MVNPEYQKQECAGCIYADAIRGICLLRASARAKRCRTLPQMVNDRKLLVTPRNVKEHYFCDVCNDTFEGEPGKHVNGVHGEEYHSSESMIDFEERHISECD